MESPTLVAFDKPVDISSKQAAKRAGGRGPRGFRPQQQFVIDSDEGSDWNDSIAGMVLDNIYGSRRAAAAQLAASAHNPSGRRNYNSNVIEIDCDDVFAGGPAVCIDRDLAAAPACTAADNAALKINVRFNGTVEVYDLRRVSEIHELFPFRLDFNPINSCLSLVSEIFGAGCTDCREKVCTI